MPKPTRDDTHKISVLRDSRSVTNDETWFSDLPPDLGPGFSSADAEQRRTTVVEILLRATKEAEKTDSDEAEGLFRLVDKLQACRPRRRCGSLACPPCARAWQKAKTAAHEELITATKKGPTKKPVFVTVIPKKKMYQPGQFSKIDIKKANRWLKDVLKPIGNRTIVGSADLGWETRRGAGYIQVHWHLVMWTKKPKKLKRLFSKEPRSTSGRLKCWWPRTWGFCRT
jgi:hypothetical protein